MSLVPRLCHDGVTIGLGSSLRFDLGRKQQGLQLDMQATLQLTIQKAGLSGCSQVCKQQPVWYSNLAIETSQKVLAFRLRCLA